jgi:hypothetical protein
VERERCGKRVKELERKKRERWRERSKYYESVRERERHGIRVNELEKKREREKGEIERTKI